MKTAIRAAHECGVKIFLGNRFKGTELPPNHLKVDHGGLLMAEHPEWQCVHPDGSPARHLSFAFSEVRNFYVRLFREWAEDYLSDGVHLIFSRSQPFVYYEQPVCRAFEAEYGEDMRKLPVGDERAQRIRAGFVTQLLREVRAMLDEVGNGQNRYISLCCTVPINNSPPNIPREARESSVAECLFGALDVQTWIEENLCDYLVMHIHSGPQDGSGNKQKIREFTDPARGTRTRIYADVYPRRMPPRQFRTIAMNYYEAGVDGLSFWDSYNRYYRASEWAFLKRLGHRKDLERWEGKGDDYYRVLPLKSLDGYEIGQVFSRPTDG